MKKFKILTLLSGALLMGGAGAAAQPTGTGKCKDIPLVFSLSFFYPVGGTTPAAFYSDGDVTRDFNPSYVDGVDGVYAVLHVCGTNPSNDAILFTGNSQRSMGINLTRLVQANNLTPAWTSTPFLSQVVLKVRNILFDYDANKDKEYSFTTRAGYDLKPPNQPKNTWYRVRMQNPADQAVWPKPTDLDLIVNSPLNTSLVTVHHTPANPTTTPPTPETWTAYPDATPMGLTQFVANATQVGTLLQDQNNGTPVNLGQFTVPFVITITRK